MKVLFMVFLITTLVFLNLVYAQSETILTQFATPASPLSYIYQDAYGTKVAFICDYRDYMAGGTPVINADVYIRLDSRDYQTTYNSYAGKYVYISPTPLTTGDHTWLCVASAEGYQTKAGSPQKYTITPIPTTMTQSVSPLSPLDYQDQVDENIKLNFICDYKAGSSPVLDATVYVNIDETDYLTSYDSELKVHNYNANVLNAGTHSWYCHASGSGKFQPQTSNAEEYTIIPSSTSLTQRVMPESPIPYTNQLTEIIPYFITFICDYTSGGSFIPNANVYVNLDGVRHSTLYDAFIGGYAYVSANVLDAGDHTWNCEASKTNYESQTGSPQKYSITPIPTTLSQSVYPLSPLNYQDQVDGNLPEFSCSYKSDGVIIPDAEVYVNIGGIKYPATYNPITGLYVYKPEILNTGNYVWYCEASKKNYESKVSYARSTYTVTPVKTRLSQSAYPIEITEGESVEFSCDYRDIETNSPILDVDVYIVGLDYFKVKASYSNGKYRYSPYLKSNMYYWNCEASKKNYEGKTTAKERFVVNPRRGGKIFVPLATGMITQGLVVLILIFMIFIIFLLFKKSIKRPVKKSRRRK